VEALVVLAVIVVIVLIARAVIARAARTQKPSSATAAALSQRLSSVPHMSGKQFEHFVADVMRELGYRVQMLGSTGDQGVDLVATSGGEERLAVQCKQYASPVGNKPIQEVFAGAKHHRCTAAWVVAPEGFTKGAVELARSVGVSLYDARSLRVWVRQIISSIDSERANLEPRTVDLDEVARRERNPADLAGGIVDLGESEDTIEGDTDKHTVKVGNTDEHSTIGEAVSFTADLLGTANVNGGLDAGGMAYTFYRLPDGNFRVLVKYENVAVLHPSNMLDAARNGQRNNYSYGRMSLEEMNADSTYKFGEVYAKLMEKQKHSETV
jgi:HJR/Mrr/RecB family endonuclease